MEYKDVSIKNLINKMHIILKYYDNNLNFIWYQNTVDIIIETVGDLKYNQSLMLILKFIVPDDYPNPDNIYRIDNITLFLYNSSITNFFESCIIIDGNDDIHIFGKRLIPGQEANITFILPALYFSVYKEFEVSGA